MAALCAGIRADGNCRGEHHTRGLSRRPCDQCRLRRQESSRHHRTRLRDCRDLHDQGDGDLWRGPAARPDRKPNHRRKSVQDVLALAAAKSRLLRGPPQLGVHGAPHHRCLGGNPGIAPSHHLDRTRSVHAHRSCRGDGLAGPGDVAVQRRGRAAGNADAAQDDQADQDGCPSAIHRQYPHPRDNAGNAAGHSHHQSLRTRAEHAQSL